MRRNDPQARTSQFSSPVLLCLIGLACTATPCHAEHTGCSFEVLALDDNGDPAPAGLRLIVLSGEQRFSGTIEAGNPVVSFPELPCGDVSIGLHSGGGAPWHTELGRARLERDVPGSVIIRTHPLGRIDVTVLDREGQPNDQAGARVQALATADAVSAGNILPITLDEGQTRYVVRQGQYRLTLMPENRFVAAKIDGKTAHRPVTVEVATEPVQVTFTVRGTRILRGRVEDAEGNAIRWANVTAFRPGPLPPSYRRNGLTNTGEDGTFELGVDHLPVDVIVKEENRIFEPAHRLVRSYDERLLFVGHPIRTERRLEGRLVDQQSGEPLAAAAVTMFTGCDETDLPAVEQYRSYMNVSIEADSEGRFSLPCSSSCPMQLRFSPRQLGFVHSRVEVPEGRCDSLGTIEIPRAGILKITVRDARGEPVPSLRLAGLATSKTTDGRGRVQITWFEAGTYPLWIDRVFDSTDRANLVLVSANETATHGREAVAVIEKPGDHVELSLSAVPGGVLCLEAVDQQGKAVRIAAAEVRHDNGIPVAAATGFWPTRKKDQRRLCTRPLQAGDYRVQARGPEFIRSWWPGEQEAARAMTVHVDAGQTVTLSAMVVEPAGSINALLPGWVGEGQQELVWELRPAQTPTQPWSRHSPDSFGCRMRPGWIVHPGPGGPKMLRGINCRLTDLPVGVWHIRAHRPDSNPERSAWSSVEPVTVRRGRLTHVVLEPTEAAGAR